MRAARPIIAREVPGRSAAGNLDSIDQVLAQLFLARGVTAASELDYSLAELAPISSLEHVAEAVELILKHRDERIVIIGDFDVDGATSTALLLRCFTAFGFKDVD